MGNKYRVRITRYAFEQIKEIDQYITSELLAPEAAKNLLVGLRKTIASLEMMPARHPLVEEELWQAQGVRWVKAKNFLIYYWVNEKEKIVHITAVVYEKRNQISQLMKMDME